MRRSRRAEEVIQSSSPNLKAHDVNDELTSAWKGLAQSKAALRQIENKLEAGPGTGVLLESIKAPSKKKTLRKDEGKDGQQGDHKEKATKISRNSQSPEKSNSRGPLQNSTQDNTARTCVEFREPLASYREATPPPHPSPLDHSSLQSVPGSSFSSQPSNSNPVLSHLVYQRDTRDKQTDRDSSTMERMEFRYLNDLPALDTIRTNLSHPRALTKEAILSNSSLKAQHLQSTDSKESGSTPSTSPGSASQRLENLRRHQPDDKLEKLKERIRKQRQHLEETAEKEKTGSYLEQPFIGTGNCGTFTVPTVKVRKVAPAPSAPIYKGFNGTETKIQTPDGKIWHEEDFHNLSREMYKDLSRQFTESTKSQLQRGQGDISKERKHHKPVRKVQKVVPASDVAKPVISPASWREGQKLVKMVLGKEPTLTFEESQKMRRNNQKGSHCRSSSEPCAGLNRPNCPQNTVKTSSLTVQEPVPAGSDILSANIKGILDDLQLQFKTTERGERARATSRRGTSRRQVRGSSGSRTRAPVSTWGTTSARGCRSASPINRSQTVYRDEAVQKKRHYDADTVRQYIVQQQEKRKRQQVEEKNTQREEAKKRQQRLQELYRKQREVAKTVASTTAAPAQVRLHEPFNKLLLEEAQLEEATQMRPLYQPSGESDKENIRLEQAQSPSSSDRSLNHHPISRNDFDFGLSSSAHFEHVIPTTPPVTGPACSNEHLLSQLLRLESAIAASEKQTKRPITALSHSPDKKSRIEALKATAKSLSNRIASEACQLAGENFSYGLITAGDVDKILAPRSSHTRGDDRSWTEVESEDMAFNTERTSGARTMYNRTGFPEQDFAVFKTPFEKNRRVNSWTRPQSSTVPHSSSLQDRKWLANAMEEDPKTNRQLYEMPGMENNCPDGHDSSESISEGPLSEGSFTDGDHSPPQSANPFRPIGHQGAVLDSLRKSHQRMSEFQKDAEKCATLNSLLAHQENSKPAWEEFNKGSPLSVINIFTKSLQGNVKVGDMYSERNSPAHLLPSSSHDFQYENDFVSTQSSGASGQKDNNALCSSNHYEELLRRSTGHSSVQSPQRSSYSTPGSSPHSKNSTKIRDKISDQCDATLVEEHRSSPASEALSSECRKRDLKRSSEQSQVTSEDISGLSHQRQSPPGSMDQSSLESNSFSEPLRRSFPEKSANTNTAVYSGLADVKASGELQYSPAVLQQRMAAELHYLDTIEESVRQLGDIERLMGVSVAQHESASISQILKAKQQQHEQELYELKIKTEREALETKLQMEENRQRVARAHTELQEGLAATHKETLEGLQEATTKMMSQQAEAARYTADTARHIKEMTEMAHAHLMTYNPASVHTSELLRENSHARTRDKAILSYESSRTITDEHPSDRSDPESFRSPGLSEPDSNYHHSLSSEHNERRHEPPKEKTDRAEGSISIEEEVPTAANESLCSNSIPSAVEEKGDTTSVATEYSHKFDESITEDEMEERSFRTLLPSEAHRRESLDKKLQHHDESEEDGACHNGTPDLVAHNILKHQEVSSAFSGGQDSFSHFTMEMVRQYMKDEEVRLQHQSALLRLRQKALKEKTRTELAWLEHQKKKLRDKGEDDKMPPIKKKQRGLLLKLQQEQAEIKRLQEANKAARKERQLLLKQQEEIERMRSSTLKLKERLRCAATEAPSETSLSELASPKLENVDPNIRSPSPSLSISGSETSSIMQKLKKMRSQMDEKFLTKREQQLMQRRRHAEELLQWKQRLDQEEAEVRKMEKKALAVWDEQTSQNKGHNLSESEKDFNTSQRQKDFTGDVELSATPESSIHTDVEVQQETPVWAKNTSASEIASIQSSPANYTDDFTSVSPSPDRQKSTIKYNVEATPSEHADQMSNQTDTTGSPVAKQTEHISDQSDIESRIRALKEELRKRKFTAYQLKKEQKKRTKERLKAKEANLLKQLETYNHFIEKTQAELNKQPDSTPDTTSQMTEAIFHNTEYPRDKTTLHRNASESERIPTLVDKALSDRSRSTSVNSISEEEPTTVTPTPRPDSPDLSLTSKDLQAQSQESQNYNVTSEHESEMQEEIKLELGKLSEDQDSKCLLKLDMENEVDTASESVSHHSPSFSQELDICVDSRPEAETAAESLSTPTDKFTAADIPTHASSSAHSNEETCQRKASPPLADRYNTFESSVDASLRENNSTSQLPTEKSFNCWDQTSLKKDVLARTSRNDSLDKEIEEEIAEELSGLSVDSNRSLQFIGALDAHVEELKTDGRNTVSSNHSAAVTPLVTDEMPGFCVGDRVVVSGVQPGTLRFKGSTSFANGFWAGVELDKSEGSNNGTYDGVLYFECAERHGIFAPPDKITPLTDKFEMYTDTTEDDDSFHDDMLKKENQKHQTKETRSQTEQRFKNGETLRESGDTKGTDALKQLDKALYDAQYQKHLLRNGKNIWAFGDVSPTPLIEDKQAQMELINLVERSDVELNHQLVISSDLKSDEGLKDKLGSLADKMLSNFVTDTVQQFAELKKLKAKKIHNAIQKNRNVFEGVENALASSVDQKDGLPFFLTQEKEEMSSPELCNRPESPMLGISGQEELAKRLAELELSRELDEFGDDQDWFDEDYGLSSRREQQRLKQKQLEEEEQEKLEGNFGKTVSGAGMGGLVPSPGEQQVKTPPRPELPHPLPPKLPEEPAMVVPHSAAEIEKMAHAAALEIWKTCGLNRDEAKALTQQQKPNPSQEYFGEEPCIEEQEAVCLHSYKKAVFDLTWEILQDVFAEDPNADQPQWVKPQRVRSSSFHKVRTAGDIGRIQKFVTTEVLKLYGLAKDQCQQTDWPKMLKFGRKKRDRVDHILVQELHEEESQWVNYDEDELFVKMQLADSIFDALLKDTANVLTQIYDKRSRRDSVS